MYVTAHRVRSRASREGINAFLSLHRDSGAREIDWAHPVVQQVAQQNPGTLVFRECDLKPGGNDVRSFLDVVASDETDSARIRAALDAFERALESESLPYMTVIDRIGILFNAELGLEEERLDEYRVLKRRLLSLMDHWAAEHT